MVQVGPQWHQDGSTEKAVFSRLGPENGWFSWENHKIFHGDWGSPHDLGTIPGGIATFDQQIMMMERF